MALWCQIVYDGRRGSSTDVNSETCREEPILEKKKRHQQSLECWLGQQGRCATTGMGSEKENAFLGKKGSLNLAMDVRV